MLFIPFVRVFFSFFLQVILFSEGKKFHGGLDEKMESAIRSGSPDGVGQKPDHVDSCRECRVTATSRVGIRAHAKAAHRPAGKCPLRKMANPLVVWMSSLFSCQVYQIKPSNRFLQLDASFNQKFKEHSRHSNRQKRSSQQKKQGALASQLTILVSVADPG